MKIHFKLLIKKINDEDAVVTNYNISVASFVTAYARLELLNLMEKIEIIRPKSVLYHDTDSVIYYRKLTDEPIKTGDYLGNLTDEIAKYGEDAKCNEFVSLGPKNYGYTVKLPNKDDISEIKCKGITFNAAATKQINIKKMIDLAQAYSLEHIQNQILVRQRRFLNTKHYQVFTQYSDKKYQPVSEKRVIQGNFTVPFGYKESV